MSGPVLAAMPSVAARRERTLFDVGQAYVLLEKAAGEAPQSVYALSGRLVYSKSGWGLLEVPNALVRGVFDALDVPGVELPPSGPEGRLNAHISCFRKSEIEALGGPGKISEWGKRFRYQLGPLQTVKPDGWGEMSKVWLIRVISPEIKALRRSYGLSELPKGYELHCTVAVRRKGALGNNDVSKAAVDDGMPAYTIDRPRGFKKRFPTPSGPVEKAYPVDYGYFNDYVNPDDNEYLDVFVGSGGPHHGRFMKGQNLTGEWMPDERKWFTGLTDDERLAMVDLFHSQSPDLLRDFRSFRTPDELVADIAPYRRPKDAALNPDVQLQEHQRRVAEDDGSLLVYHPLGSGKTLAAIAAAEQGGGAPYAAVVPAALRPQFRREQERFTDQTTPSTVMSYDAAARGADPGPIGTLIVDEAHRLRNPGTARAAAVGQLASNAGRTLLLTGSPIVNRPGDLGPLAALVGADVPADPGTFESRYLAQPSPGHWYKLWTDRRGKPGIRREGELRRLLEGKVDYVPPRPTDAIRSDERVETTLSGEEQRVNDALFGSLPNGLVEKLFNPAPFTPDEASRLRAFLTGARQAGLSGRVAGESDPLQAAASSTKIQAALSRLKRTLDADPRSKALVFSNFVRSGLEPYAASLEEAGVPHGVFHGGLDDARRKALVEDYNRGKLRTLLIGPSGSEGLSFKGTNLVQLLDPHWNSARGEQSAGRALRYDSHTGLPEELRGVKVQRFSSQARQPGWIGRLRGRRSTPTADEILERISREKDERIEPFLELLRDVGTPKEAADFAPGLPARADLGPLDRLRAGQLLDWIVQKHDAARAGTHYDVRFGDKDLGLLSWAARKGLPRPGEKHLAVRQPVHRHGYKDFEGEIPAGSYGAGAVRKHDEGQVLITKVTPDAVHFSTAHQRHPSRFALIRPKGWGGEDWLLMNTTPQGPVPYEKVRYKTIPADRVEPALRAMQEGDTAEAKIDGASQLVQLVGGNVETMSYRTSKQTGRPIFHSERFFQGRPEVEVPQHLEGSIAKGELYAAHTGRPATAAGVPSAGEPGITATSRDGGTAPRTPGGDQAATPRVGSPQDVSTLLNSSVARSLQLQKERGLTLKNMLFDIQQYGKTPIDPYVTPRSERRKMLEEILHYLPPEKFHLAEEAKDPDTAIKLWDTIRSGRHPLTQEGAILWPSRGLPSKAKLRPDFDVVLTGTYPGHGKRQGTVGGFTYGYGHEPAKTVGRVGTGFSDEFLQDVARDPSTYVGRVARLQAHERLPSGALRGPSFIGLNEDYNSDQLGRSVRPAGSDRPRTKQARVTQQLVDLPLRLRDGEGHQEFLSDREGREEQDAILRLLVPRANTAAVSDARPVHYEGVSDLAQPDPALHRQEFSELFQLRRPWDHGLRTLAEVRGVSPGHGAAAAGHEHRAEEQRRSVFPGQLQVGDQVRADEKQAEQPTPDSRRSDASGGGLGGAQQGPVRHHQKAAVSGLFGRGRGITPVISGTEVAAASPALATLLQAKAAGVDERGHPCPDGECCPHPDCRARLERGDDGSCNRCGRPWPKQALHTTTHNEHTYDVDALLARLADRPVEQTPLASLFIDRSSRSGFGRRRLAATDTSYPGVLDEQGRILDGRHRAAKLQDAGAESFSFRRATPEDLAAVKISSTRVDGSSAVSPYRGPAAMARPAPAARIPAQPQPAPAALPTPALRRPAAPAPATPVATPQPGLATAAGRQLDVRALLGGGVAGALPAPVMLGD